MGKASVLVSVPPGKPIQAGAKLEGSVIINVQSEISARGLTVKLWGREYAEVHYSRTVSEDGNSRQETKTASATRNIVEIPIMVDISSILQNGKLLPGQHEYPFEMVLPDNIPASVYVSSGGYCYIKYTLKAILEGSGMLVNYHHNLDISVSSRAPPQDPVPFHGPPTVTPIKVCCCFGRGNMVLGGTVANTAVSKGANVDFVMSARNQSLVRVQSVTATLRQAVEWYAQGHYDSQHIVLGTFQFPVFGGLETKPAVLGLDSNSAMQEIHQEMEQALHKGNLIIPPNALETFGGGIITIRHELDICLNTRTCATSPSLMIPIQILGPAASHSSEVIPPPPSQQVNMGGAVLDVADHTEEPDVSFETLGPSVANLLKEMELSVNDLDIVNSKMRDASWRNIIINLSPTDYGSMIKQVEMDFDQPRVAAKVAEEHTMFTCEHVSNAMKNCSEWNRGAVVEKLIPYCKDFKQNYKSIESELSEWDKTVTASAFQQALNA